MSTTQVSIVIPAFNEEQSIGALLSSIAHQTVEPDQVIVVNNNSNDNTARIASSFDFVTLVEESTPGLVAARAAGYKAATSNVIANTDADTVLSPEWIEVIKNRFDRDSELAAMSGPTYYHDMPLNRFTGSVDHGLRRALAAELQFAILYGPNTAIRKQAWEDISHTICDDSEIHEDLDLSIHLFEAGYKTVYDEDMLIGVSARRTDDTPRDYFRYVRKISKTIGKHNIPPALSAYITEFVVLAAYPAASVLRRSFDPDTRNLSIKMMMRGKNTPRVSPMTGGEED